MLQPKQSRTVTPNCKCVRRPSRCLYPLVPYHLLRSSQCTCMRVEPFASHDRNPCSLSPMRQSQLLPCKGPGTAWRVPVPHTTRLHAERTLRCRCRAAPGSRSSPVPREPQVPAKRAQAAATEQLVFTGTSQESESEDELECVSTGLGDVACEIVHHRHHRPATPAPATAPLNPALQAVLMMSPFAFWVSLSTARHRVSPRRGTRRGHIITISSDSHTAPHLQPPRFVDS